MVEIIANIVSVLILLTTAIIAAIQINEIRRATYATAFKAIYDIIQAEDIRAARGIVQRNLKEKPLGTWTEEEIKAAEKVCHSYDSVGIMIRNNMVPVEVVADSWGDSLRKTWRILSPLVASYRVQRNSNEFWDDYEWLAKQAEKYQKPIHTIK
jgi:hypothetical protein